MLFKRINVIERIVFSFALSIVVVTLSLLVINWRLGIRVIGFNSVVIILAVTIIPLAIYFTGRLLRKNGEETDDNADVEDEGEEDEGEEGEAD